VIFLLSHLQNSRKLGSLRAFNINASPPAHPSHLTSSVTMAALLRIASGVEAAVTAYNSVRDFANKQEWQRMFTRERVSAHLHGVLIATFEIE
jgi:hypothetical protein